MVLQEGLFVEIIGSNYRGRFGTVLEEKGTASVLLQLQNPKKYVTIRRYNVVAYFDVTDIVKSENTTEDPTPELHAITAKIKELTREIERLHVQVDRIRK